MATTKKKSKSRRVAVIDTPDGERRVSFSSVRELAARFPSNGTRAFVGTEIRRKMTVPSLTEQMVVTSMPTKEQRKAGYGVGVEGVYRDYDGGIRKISGEFSNRGIRAMLHGTRDFGGLTKSRSAKSLSRKRALELFGGPERPSKADPSKMVSTMYGDAPRYTRESVRRGSSKRMAKAGSRFTPRSNPVEYLSDSIDQPIRPNPAPRRGRRGGSARGKFPFRRF